MNNNNTHEVMAYIEQVLAIAQSGLAYSKDPYDIERFTLLRQLSAELMANTQGLDLDRVAGWIDVDEHYATPKIDVRALVLDDDGKILLVQESSDRNWTLPGGWCDIGESAGEAVVRETFEETGLHVTPLRLLALFDKRKHDHPPQMPHAHKCFFLCKSESGTLTGRTSETSAAGYFPLDALPPLSLHRLTKNQLMTVAHHARSGNLHALFD
ncbi:NUDIX hydrolase [Noviherbaspirillum aerium]|uniref:NUDIX hydrolase n=1 Tax=Noviherbaspirillum aerium TaxID=2588497 RepID=UPI00124C64CA|nr:NUDIX hydrolase [Noviherbaspirillum aerium]